MKVDNSLSHQAEKAAKLLILYFLTEDTDQLLNTDNKVFSPPQLKNSSILMIFSFNLNLQYLNGFSSVKFQVQDQCYVNIPNKSLGLDKTVGKI